MPPPAIHMVNACGWWSRPRLRPSAGIGLDHRRAAELAAPDDQRVVEQPALLQVLDQRRRRLVGRAAVALQVAGDVRVRVPAFVIDVDEAHARARSCGGPAGRRGRTTACRDRRRTSPASPSIPTSGPSVPGAEVCSR